MRAMARIRLDQLLVARGLAETRARARDAVLRGAVTVDGRTAAKPGEPTDEAASIVIDDPAAAYVSRAALKLVGGLDGFGFSVEGAEALDIGASTGGFTQVLLERGAARVTAIDVGHGQLHARIAADPRVIAREGLNARDLSLGDLPARPDVIVSDVSFISLRLALPPALGLAAPVRAASSSPSRSSRRGATRSARAASSGARTARPPPRGSRTGSTAATAGASPASSHRRSRAATAISNI